METPNIQRMVSIPAKRYRKLLSIVNCAQWLYDNRNNKDKHTELETLGSYLRDYNDHDDETEI